MSSKDQDLIELSQNSAQEIYKTFTKDGVAKELDPDLIIEKLTKEQFANWKSSVEKEDSKYFIKKSIGVEMTPDQHRAVSEFISDAFARLASDGKYEFKEDDHLDVVFTKHFFRRLKQRSSRKIEISYEHTASLTEFVTEYGHVETAFRYNNDGISYRLKNNKPETDSTSYERISFSLVVNDKGTTLLINFITFINKKERSDKPKKRRKRRRRNRQSKKS